MSTTDQAPAYEQGAHTTPVDKKPTINTDVPATQGEPSGLSHNTHVPQSSTSGAETAPTSPATAAPARAHTPTKSELKEQKNYEKLVAKDEKHEAKNLKDATKAADKARKAEEKSLKEEGKANRQVEKSKKAEYKAKQKLIKAQNAHEKAASDLERNIGIANNKTTHHKEMQEDHKTKMAKLESFRHTKEAHDHEREQKLAAHKPAASSS